MACCIGPEGSKISPEAIMCKVGKMQGCDKKKGGGMLNLEGYLTTLVNLGYTPSRPGME